MRRHIAAFMGVLGLATLALPAAAQQGPPPNIVQVRGTVQSVDASSLSVASNGATTKFALPPMPMVSVIKKIAVADIKSGSFIGTTNVDKPDGSGQSTEVHVFPPGVRMGEGHYPMGASGNMMTNGDVTMVVAGAKGQELDIKYNGQGGSGVRHVVVPPDTPVISMTPGDVSMLKPGTPLSVVANKDASGAMTVLAINLGENGAPPPM
jgi:hypothetical protein